MSNPPLLNFTPWDLEQAHEDWGCNCGPAALAACLGMTLDDVWCHLGRFCQLHYMNRDMMFQAVRQHGFRATVDLVADQDGVDRYPTHGLCLVQFGGPWVDDPKLAKWGTTQTHWIASKIDAGVNWIFDVNYARWVEWQTWHEELIPRLVRRDKYRDGTYWLSTSWEIRKSR